MLSIKEIENIGFRLDTLLSRRDLLLPKHTAEVYEMAKAYVSLVEKINDFIIPKPKIELGICDKHWVGGYKTCLNNIKSFIDKS